MKTENKAMICALLTVLSWSSASTAFKIALSYMDPTQLIFISMLTACLFLSFILLFIKQGKDIFHYSLDMWLKVFLLGIVLYAYYVILFLGYDRLPAQIAQPLNNTWAIVLALFSVYFLKQKLTLKEFGYIVFAYTGVLIIAIGGQKIEGSLSFEGLIFIIITTFLYPFYWIANKKFQLPFVFGLWGSFGIASIFAFLTLLFSENMLPQEGLFAGMYVGLFELAVPFILWGQAIKLTQKVSRIATLSFLVPFLALFWVNIILKEPIALSTIIGLCFIVVGTFFQQKESAKNMLSLDKSNKI